MTSYKIVKTPTTEKMLVRSMDRGQFYLDLDGDLCLRIGGCFGAAAVCFGGHGVFPTETEVGECKYGIPVNVTITVEG